MRRGVPGVEGHGVAEVRDRLRIVLAAEQELSQDGMRPRILGVGGDEGSEVPLLRGRIAVDAAVASVNDAKLDGPLMCVNDE